MPEEWVEGETGPRKWILMNEDDNGIQSPENLTGKDVSLILRRQDNTLVDTSGDVVVTSAENGEVQYTPDPTDMAVSKSPLFARFEVSVGAAKKFFPKGQPDEWKIFRP